MEEDKAVNEKGDAEEESGWILVTLSKDRSGGRVHISSSYIDQQGLEFKKNAVLIRAEWLKEYHGSLRELMDYLQMHNEAVIGKLEGLLKKPDKDEKTRK